MPKMELKLQGYDYIGENGTDGIRYAWDHPSSCYCVESAAFTEHTKNKNENICGYTTSVSSGCILSADNLACKFCRTGNLLQFGSRLNAKEIAKQNVFMVLSDIHCSEHYELRTKNREFAYMGQGEPGFSYSQIRKAIQLTNIVMRNLKQNVYRHIISTSGIPMMIDEYIEDLKTGFFSSKTTLHFSMHAAQNRELIMPIEKKYPYKSILAKLEMVRKVSGNKPCVGILLFDNFCPKGTNYTFSSSFEYVKEILSILNSDNVRLSFCEFNESPDLGTYNLYDYSISNNILKYAKETGFEAKLFSSFGKKETVACGMLGGLPPSNSKSKKWEELEEFAEELVYKADEELEI